MSIETHQSTLHYLDPIVAIMSATVIFGPFRTNIGASSDFFGDWFRFSCKHHHKPLYLSTKKILFRASLLVFADVIGDRF